MMSSSQRAVESLKLAREAVAVAADEGTDQNDAELCLQTATVYALMAIHYDLVALLEDR